MKKNNSLYLFVTVSLLVTTNLQAQNLKNLENNKGFKNYKLGTKFNMGYGMKKKDADGADKVLIDYTREKIEDIPVKAIELFYLNDTLSKIIVRIPTESYIKLLDACKNSFGPPTDDLSSNESNGKTKKDVDNTGNNYKDQYVWKVKQFSMEYIYSYPKIRGDVYGLKELYLVYSLNDFSTRLQRVNKGKYTSKDF
jgi:hypothetical protein